MIPAFIGGLGIAEIMIILGIMAVLGGGVLVMVFLAARAGTRSARDDE